MYTRQEETLDALFACLSDRLSHIARHCSKLFGACSDPFRALAQCAAALRTQKLAVGAFMLAAYSSVLKADQLAAFLLSAWPVLPAFLGPWEAGLEQIRAARALEEERTSGL
jgi:hypothetical protein